MSVVRFNRFATLLVFVISLLAACRPIDTPTPATSPGPPPVKTLDETRTPNKGPFCTQGNFSKRSPLICVDPATLLAPDPTPAIVWDVEDDSSGNPTNRPVRIVWQARTNVALGIKVTTKGCLTDVRCAGPVCTAQVVPLSISQELRLNPPADKTPYIKRCTYELNLNGQVLDPDLDVNPCCW